MDRYLAVLSPNCNQWFVYDEVKDVYIDPPIEVLDMLNLSNNPEELLNEVTNKKPYPKWLSDKEYFYSDI